MFITEVVGCKCDVILASLVWDRDVKVCLCISGNDTRRTSQILWVKMQSSNDTRRTSQISWVKMQSSNDTRRSSQISWVKMQSSNDTRRTSQIPWVKMQSQQGLHTSCLSFAQWNIANKTILRTDKRWSKQRVSYNIET